MDFIWKKTDTEKRLLYQSISIKILILLVPLLIFLICAQLLITVQLNHGEKGIKQQLDGQTTAIQTSMDEYIERCQAINYVLSQNEELYYLRNNSADHVEDNVENIYYATAELKSLCLTNNFVTDIVICINQNGININKEGRVTTEEVYEKYIYQENVNYSLQDWYADSIKFTGGKLMVLENGEMYFIRTYPVTPRGASNKWVILIKIDETAGFQKLKNTDPYKDTITAILEDGTDTPIYDGAGMLLWNSGDLPLKAERGNISRDGYLISYQKSEQLNATYLSASRIDMLVHEKNMQRLVVLGAFFSCMILGAILIVINTKKEMNPIQQLLTMVEGDSSSTSSLWDPYSEIKSRLLETADQKLAQMNEQNQSKRNDIRKTLIAVLYDKKSSRALIEKHVQQADIPYEGKLSCFVKFKCVDISNFFDELKEGAKHDCTPIQFCTTIASQILSEKNEIVTISHGQEAFLIVLFENKNVEIAFREMKNQLQQTQRLLQERYGIETLIAVSNLHANIEGIESGFRECNQVAEYLEFSSDKNFEEYGVVVVLQKQKDTMSAYAKDVRQLINTIKSGELSMARENFHHIVEAYFSDMLVFNQTSKFRMYALAGNMLDAFDGLVRLQPDEWLQRWYENNDVLSFHNLAEFKENMNSLFAYAQEWSKNTEENSKNSIVQNIMGIISDNYMNPDLNVSMIANLLNKNLDYVSRVFKKSTGMGILECIQEYRIDKAKVYLGENPELTIQQVASMVGYVNCESFIRIFKHKQGVTPGRYKSITRKSE